MPSIHRSTRLVLVLVLGGLVAALSAPPLIRIASFSSASPSESVPEGWTQIRFGENESSTSYDLTRVDSTVALRARSRNGASGLMSRQRIDLEEYPILEWRWKVVDLPVEADVTEDVRDDAAARIYVTFDYDDLGVLERVKLAIFRRMGYPNAPSRALNYLWASHRERGIARTSAYTDQIMMLPVRSGSTRMGQWIRERRNVLKDYREVFGEDPPEVNGIAIMTDTDNTGGTATAFYGDILFRQDRRPDRSVRPVASDSG